MMRACETGGQGGLGVSTWAGALAGQRARELGDEHGRQGLEGPQAAGVLKGRHRKCSWMG